VKHEIHFIREDPWISQVLRTFRPLNIVPKEIHDWFWDLARDVGAVMRSREMIVYFIASLGYDLLKANLISLIEDLGIMPRIARGILK